MSVGIRGNRWKLAESLAATGTVIANAAAITKTFTTVTGNDDAKGVVLPSAPIIGTTYLVYAEAATSGLLVYPPVNGTINGGSANAAVTMEGKTMGMFIATNSTNYAAMFTANS
jgi:hypothetical protein